MNDSIPARDNCPAFYDALYSHNPRLWDDASRDAFAFQTLALGSPANMLDVGCGNGHTIRYFKRFWPETQYTGLDWSPVALDIAAKMDPDVTYICGEIGKTALRRYQLVTALGVVEHFEDLQAGLSAVRETISDGGLAYIEAPNCIGYATSEPIEGFRQLNIGSRQHEWHLRRPTWEEQLRKAGLEILVSKTGPSITCEFVWIVGRAA